MEWSKVSIQTNSSGIEPLTDLLLTCGISGVEIIDPREYNVYLQQDKTSWDYVDESLVNIPADDRAYVVFYLPADANGDAELARIKDRWGMLHDCGIGADEPSVTVQRVDDTAWLDEWKKHFAPIRIGKVAIVPAWEAAELPPPQPEVVFTLDPGSAFGTGQHATTYLCVEALQERLKPGHTMLDAGCGSGILSVIGLLLGAERVAACDIDASAVSAARKNAELNPVALDRLCVLHGNIITDDKLRADIGAFEYDIIAANIVADVVIALLPFIPVLLKKSGVLIASGIIGERAGDVLAALPDNGLALVSSKEMDGWYCMVCTHA
ncbi:MAG: 50S ribosomal protein L11 methyltransferase [Defluviitaleaceae bacterium]|nr:50S ribosomal protein L11 methyltransferase [Defluviitaleaceae bacterium]